MKIILMDVDVQVDFCEPTGALYVNGSPNELYRRIVRSAVERQLPILGSVDSHAFDAWEFASNEVPAPQGAKPNFPDHCVKGTPGWLKVAGTLPSRSRFVPNQKGADVERLATELAEHRAQGVYFEKEVYSLFANPNAEAFLHAFVRDPSAVTFAVFGVATDYCVKAAAIGLRERGYGVSVLTDAIRAITPEGESVAFEEMQRAGCTLTTSDALGL